jgi:hypothetical protein
MGKEQRRTFCMVPKGTEVRWLLHLTELTKVEVLRVTVHIMLYLPPPLCRFIFDYLSMVQHAIFENPSTFFMKDGFRVFRFPFAVVVQALVT